MKKYLLLFTVPFMLTGCFDEETEVVAPTEEDAAVEETESVNESQNDNDNTSENDDTTQDGTDNEDNQSDQSMESSDDEDETNSVAQTASETNESGTEEQSDSNVSSSESVESNSEISENSEEEAIDAVNEYAHFDESNLLYLTHLEDNGEWMQVEVREEMEGQDQTNLIALFRRHLETGELEEFDFLEGDYMPVTESE